MRLAVVPGSFDPVTNGHMEVIGAAAAAFEKVLVAVGTNRGKSPWLSVDQRIELLREAIRAAGYAPDDVAVTHFEGLLADFVEAQGATCVVKGVRGGTDLESESLQAELNLGLSGVPTLLVPSSAAQSRVSSSLVRELLTLGAPVTPFLPPVVAAQLSALPAVPTN